jgi:hypothetical protein
MTNREDFYAHVLQSMESDADSVAASALSLVVSREGEEKLYIRALCAGLKFAMVLPEGAACMQRLVDGLRAQKLDARKLIQDAGDGTLAICHNHLFVHPWADFQDLMELPVDHVCDDEQTDCAEKCRSIHGLEARQDGNDPKADVLRSGAFEVACAIALSPGNVQVLLSAFPPAADKKRKRVQEEEGASRKRAHEEEDDGDGVASDGVASDGVASKEDDDGVASKEDDDGVASDGVEEDDDGVASKEDYGVASKEDYGVASDGGGQQG